MIDFRYHLVSIVAVFLALAIGLLVGSTNKAQDALAKLKDQQVAVVQRNNDDLRAEKTLRDKTLEGENQYASVTAPEVLGKRLANESVVFVLAPGASDTMRTGLDTAVKTAGGTVSGWVSLQSKYLDPAQLATIDELALSTKPGSLTFADDATGYDKAAAVLANVLVTKDSTKAGREELNAVSTLQSFKEAGLLSYSGKPTARATLAIVIAPDKPVEDEKTAAADNKALISLTSALDANNRGTVAAGDTGSAGTNGFLSALRSSKASDTVSSADAADRVSGQNVVVLALDAEMDGKSGKYGTVSGDNGFLPNPLPTPVAMAGHS
ncbi:copper transporter [Actinocorallia longicatena]|uniref:Copper transporter n=1 Tax=Actinocorallia longicatena TaxID=111803 RepID=A0ABP6QPA9_9ACTN